MRTGSSDRVYFAGDRQLLGVRARDFQPVGTVALDAPLRTVVSTPSGDRLYVVTQGARSVVVVDRFRDAVSGTIALPGAVAELRIDPLGRYLLARAAAGDSAWVIAVSDNRVVGSLPTVWRADLPLVLPDGAIASVSGADVAFVEGESLKPRGTVPGGAADFWHVVLWNGFRPRAAGLDRPVTFGGGREARADTSAVDSSATDSMAPPPDTTPPPTPPETTQTLPPLPPLPTTLRSQGEVALPAGRGYTVQFAAAESEREAITLASRVKVAGLHARVVPSTRRGRQLFRVVTGPFGSRADAERNARASGRTYWVFEGVP